MMKVQNENLTRTRRESWMMIIRSVADALLQNSLGSIARNADGRISKVPEKTRHQATEASVAIARV
jgi:hypothetical protein